MPRRIAFALLLAGCAAGATSAQAPGPLPQPPAATAPPSSVTFLLWLSDFRGRALAAGVPAAVFDREMAGVAPNPRVTQLDGAQPEFSKPIGAYVKGSFSPARVTAGRRYRTEMPILPRLEQQTGVPPELALGVWAMESAFGAIQGDFDVIRSMATLAADGRRRAFAEGELIAALKIIASGEVTRTQLKGSWAGAMGQTQFIPSTYLATALDGDGDRRRDIWGSNADALASTANLLGKAGWKRGGDWAREVTLPAGFDYSLTEGPKLTPAAWAERGVKRADGRAWPTVDAASNATLIAPAGAGGPAFLLFPNHYAIREYNNSVAYALAVGLLADAFAGRPDLARPWPAETPLSLAERVAAQQSLKRLGFDPGTPDGVVGLGTRAALRAWQKARGLTADGYLSPEMVRRLRSEASG